MPASEDLTLANCEREARGGTKASPKSLNTTTSLAVQEGCIFAAPGLEQARAEEQAMLVQRRRIGKLFL